MNICLVTPYYVHPGLPPSGIATHFYELANSLSELGHQVHVVFPTNSTVENLPPKQESSIFLHPISITVPTWLQNSLPGKGNQKALLKKIWRVFHIPSFLNQLVQKYDIDIVETSSYDFLCVAYLLRKNRPPVLTRVATTVQQIDSQNPSLNSPIFKIFSFLEQLMIRCSDRLLTHTFAHRDEICNAFKINPDQFHVIPHGIQIPQNIEIEKPDHLPEKMNILYVGRLEYRKGIDVLLEAIPPILNVMDNINFTIVGKDVNNAYQNQFQQKWNHQFDHRVTFAGTLGAEQLKQMYRECDLFVAPSRYESFGLIYVEAAIYGKPVIGCKAGGIPEVIEEGVTGLLASPGDSQDLAEKILQLARNPELRYHMGKKGRQRAEAFFSREQMAKRTVETYDRYLHSYKRLT